MTTMVMNDSSDDAENVLNEFQAFLNQYSVDESSVLGDSNEYIPGTFVSYSPSGFPSPRSRSSRNSPRLPSLVSSPRSMGFSENEKGFTSFSGRGSTGSGGEGGSVTPPFDIDAETKEEKTTKFDRSFFLNSSPVSGGRGGGGRGIGGDPDIVITSRGDATLEEREDAHRRENDARGEGLKEGTNPNVNRENSNEVNRLEIEKVRDGDGEHRAYANKVHNGTHTQAYKVDEGLVYSNLGPHGGLQGCSNDPHRGPTDEVTGGGGEMGNSGSSRRHQSSSRGDRVRNLRLESLDSVFVSKDEENNNIDGPSYVHTDNDSYIFEDNATIEDILYGDTRSKNSRKKDSASTDKVSESVNKKDSTSVPETDHSKTNEVKVGNFSESEIISTDFRKPQDRKRATYTPADLVVPELIIDALGDISDEPTKEEDDDDDDTPPTTADSGYAMSPTSDSPTLAERSQPNFNHVDRNHRTKNSDDDDYPIIYRRSKNDPGSKKYQAVVNELSTVLEKRSGTSRTQSMRDSLSRLEDGGDKNDSSGSMSRRMSRSTEHLNVFANKSLLSKLENHLLSRQAKSSNSEDDSSQSHSNTLRSQAPQEDSKQTLATRSTGTNPPEFQSSMLERGEQPSVTKKTSTSKGPGDTYSKRVSAKLIYNHSPNTSLDQDIYGNHDISFRRDDHIDSSTPMHSDRETSFNAKTAKSTAVNVVTISSSERNVSKTVVNDRPEQHRQHIPETRGVGHSLNWARSRAANSGDNKKVSKSGGVIFTSSHSSSSDNHDSMDRYAKKKKQKYASSILISNRRSLDYATDSSTSTNGSRGHTSTIEISGRGQKRRSTITYSEPDIYHRANGRPSKHSGHTASGESFHLVSHTSSPSSHPHPTLPASSIQQLRHDRHDHQNDSWASSRDVSFTSSVLDETGVYYFDQNSLVPGAGGGGAVPMASSGEQRFIKVDVAGESAKGTSGSLPRGNESLDTYFISTSSGRRRPVSLPPGVAFVDKPSPSAVSMTTIVEHSNARNSSVTNGKIRSTSVENLSTVPKWTSVIDQHGRGRPVTVYRAVSLRSSNPPLQHRNSAVTRSHSKILERIHTLSSSSSSIPNTFSTSSRFLKPESSSSTTFSSSASSHNGNMSVHYEDNSNKNTNAKADESSLYVVVPSSQKSVTTVPDIIGDHQRHGSYVTHGYVGHSSSSSTQQERQSEIPTYIDGSPFHQEIFEGALPPATGDGLHRGEEDKAAVFFIDARGMQGDPSVQVDGPNSIAKCSIDPQKDGQYKVTYIPTEVGLFNAVVQWNGKEIPGSPFHPKIVDPRKVRVVGGWQHYMDSQERVHLVVGEEKQIPFDTSDAGPGQLRAEVKSPSAFIPVSVDDEQKGKSVVKFVPKEEGNHYIHLYWSDHPLVNSPYLGFATSGMADPSKVWLSGRGLREGVVMEENEFFIDGSQAGQGEPVVELIGVRAEVKVFTTSLGGGKHRCTYVPKIPGAYLLHISWNGRQLRGSPYKVNVIGASYPSRVVVNGEGLKGGLLGQNMDFRIDTRKAGPGELTAYCMGPSRVAYCELSDHHDGTYKLAVRAQEVGQHVLQIKYGGEHVQGSPFTFNVAAQPDASKVRVSGPGVEHGLLARFQSQFIVETKGAGAGQLTVRIRGPKGAFQVEMYRQSQKDRTILCRYYPTVTGLYIINVRWSGVEVPGSPFQVNILDTQQELEQILNEHSMLANGHHPNYHNVSSNSINHSRASNNFHHQQLQTTQVNHHNTSRNSGFYQWHE